MKLFTEVIADKSSVILSLSDRIAVLGSCFSDSIGARLATAGFNVLRNPFGTLYNPASIAAAVGKLDSRAPFCAEDCVEMGAAAGLICSYSHHTSFARPTAGEFLAEANASLATAADFWHDCNKVIITLGTSFVWRAVNLPTKPVVANCLKRPASEFSRERLTIEQTASLLIGIVKAHPEKKFIFTVSPIRHLADGAHANTLSKAILHLGIDEVLGKEANAAYFPAFEIEMDELRDYRFYADDLVHPNDAAVQIIWEKFIEACVPPKEREQLKSNEKESKRANHREIHHFSAK